MFEIKINKEWLKEQNACEKGIEWFNNHFSGDVDCQSVLDALACEDRRTWVRWLLQKYWETSG